MSNTPPTPLFDAHQGGIFGEGVLIFEKPAKSIEDKAILVDENPPQPSLIREGVPEKSPQIKGDLGGLWKQGVNGTICSKQSTRMSPPLMSESHFRH